MCQRKVTFARVRSMARDRLGLTLIKLEWCWAQDLHHVFMSFYVKLTYYYLYTVLQKCILIYLYMVTPQDLPKSLFNGIYNIRCMLSYTQFHHNFSNTFKRQMSQNTEKRNIFAKTSEKSHVFFFFWKVFTTPKQEQCVNIKPIVLRIAFAWVSLSLSLSS